jgi:hypothetical protein
MKRWRQGDQVTGAICEYVGGSGFVIPGGRSRTSLAISPVS